MTRIKLSRPPREWDASDMAKVFRQIEDALNRTREHATSEAERIAVNVQRAANAAADTVDRGDSLHMQATGVVTGVGGRTLVDAVGTMTPIKILMQLALGHVFRVDEDGHTLIFSRDGEEAVTPLLFVWENENGGDRVTLGYETTWNAISYTHEIDRMLLDSDVEFQVEVGNQVYTYPLDSNPKINDVESTVYDIMGYKPGSCSDGDEFIRAVLPRDYELEKIYLSVQTLPTTEATITVAGQAFTLTSAGVYTPAVPYAITTAFAEGAAITAEVTTADGVEGVAATIKGHWESFV